MASTRPSQSTAGDASCPAAARACERSRGVAACIAGGLSPAAGSLQFRNLLADASGCQKNARPPERSDLLRASSACRISVLIAAVSAGFNKTDLLVLVGAFPWHWAQVWRTIHDNRNDHAFGCPLLSVHGREPGARPCENGTAKDAGVGRRPHGAGAESVHGEVRHRVAGAAPDPAAGSGG